MAPRWLENALASSLISVRREASPPPDPRDCKRIARLASNSPAAAAGLVVGDLLLEIGGQRVGPGARVRSYRNLVERRTWRFWSRGEGEIVELETTGVEIGVELRPSVEAIAERWHPLEGDVEDLFDLWEAGRFKALERRAWMHCAETLSPPGALSWLIRLSRRETPALLLLGIARWEQGRRDKGLPLIAEYADAHGQRFSPRFLALARYYLARRWADEEVRHRAVLLLRESLAAWWIAPAAALYEHLTGDPWPEDRGPHWMRPFPIAYDLVPIDADPNTALTFSFERAVAELAPDQVLLICILAGERGSAAYDDLLWRFVNYASWLGELVAGLHVITIRPERDVAHPEWWEAEDTARYLGLPLQVLVDERGQVTAAVQAERIPTVYAVDRTGLVLHEGQLDGVDIWDTLSLVASLSG